MKQLSMRTFDCCWGSLLPVTLIPAPLKPLMIKSPTSVNAPAALERISRPSQFGHCAPLISTFGAAAADPMLIQTALAVIGGNAERGSILATPSGSWKTMPHGNVTRHCVDAFSDSIA